MIKDNFLINVNCDTIMVLISTFFEVYKKIKILFGENENTRTIKRR